MSKLYFYQCALFLLFLSLSTFFIHHFHSYTKILTLIPLIPTPSSLHFHSDSRIPTPIPHITTLIPHIPTPISRIPALILCIPILIPFIPFPDSPFRFLQILMTSSFLKILKIGTFQQTLTIRTRTILISRKHFHGPLKKKILRGNHAPFINREFRKEI